VQRRPRERTYEAFGAYVRSQRQLARLSLRQAAALAQISNPYLSQIEHGLALPSVTVIRALADALQVSAETLMHLAAGMTTANGPAAPARTEQSILHDPRLNDAQRHALLAVLATFLGGSSGSDPHERDDISAPTDIRAPRRRQQPPAPSQDREVQGHA
jgi:transcriptional regulator with XRE-family HTH domain